MIVDILYSFVPLIFRLIFLLVSSFNKRLQITKHDGSEQTKDKCTIGFTLVFFKL